jgi:hypothetical protein
VAVVPAAAGEVVSLPCAFCSSRSMRGFRYQSICREVDFAGLDTDYMSLVHYLVMGGQVSHISG